MAAAQKGAGSRTASGGCGKGWKGHTTEPPPASSWASARHVGARGGERPAPHPAQGRLPSKAEEEHAPLPLSLGLAKANWGRVAGSLQGFLSGEAAGEVCGQSVFFREELPCPGDWRLVLFLVTRQEV